jgi:hypothetical protein
MQHADGAQLSAIDEKSALPILDVICHRADDRLKQDATALRVSPSALRKRLRNFPMPRSRHAIGPVPSTAESITSIELLRAAAKPWQEVPKRVQRVEILPVTAETIAKTDPQTQKGALKSRVHLFNLNGLTIAARQ